MFSKKVRTKARKVIPQVWSERGYTQINWDQHGTHREREGERKRERRRKASVKGYGHGEGGTKKISEGTANTKGRWAPCGPLVRSCLIETFC